MNGEFQSEIEAAIRAASRDELPRLIGALSQAQAQCMVLLTTSAAAQSAPADELLDVGTAAKRLGVSQSYLYRHAAQMPFTRRMGRALRFSSTGLAAYISRKKS